MWSLDLVIHSLGCVYLYTYNEMQTEIYETRPLNLHKSISLYKKESAKLSKKKYKSPYGIKRKSCFDGLGVNIFQISPPDPFHDIVEWFEPRISQILLKSASVSRTQIKNKIQQINWINGPVKVKEDFSLKGKGTQKFEFLVRMMEIFPEWIEFPPEIYLSLRKCRLQFHITQKAISSVHEAHKNIFELDSKNQKLQNFMTKFVNSIYLQKKFSENLPTYVKSEELKLTNGKKYHYIGIEKILKTHIIDDNLIRNIFDENQENLSEYVRKNGYQNKLRIVLSGDDFGVSNPIGGAERKLFALYMDTDNAKIYNTKANQLPLVLLCERSHITDLNELFSPVKRDLKRLMDNGITVQYNGIERKLEICLAYVLADNLGVCEMLGMKRNFSKGFICRYCGLTYNEMQTEIYETRSLNLHKSI
ncbi:hypothetical protein DERF_009188, partial [Dermatophagoides farinae]